MEKNECLGKLGFGGLGDTHIRPDFVKLSYLLINNIGNLIYKPI